MTILEPAEAYVNAQGECFEMGDDIWFPGNPELQDGESLPEGWVEPEAGLYRINGFLTVDDQVRGMVVDTGRDPIKGWLQGEPLTVIPPEMVQVPHPWVLAADACLGVRRVFADLADSDG